MKSSPHSSLTVTKASGEQVPFSEEKLLSSLRRSGADAQVARDILREIESAMYEGMTTRKIWEMAFSLLRKTSRSSAARYKLKRAIMELGPSGFPFEVFVADVLKAIGYETQTQVMLMGKCVKHEVDVIARKEGKQFLVECKFHNRSGTATDVKVPLYIHSRLQDVSSNNHAGQGLMHFDQAWLVTNTRFTDDAVRYADCTGIELLGWDYPKKMNLKSLIDELGLHPITCLTTLSPGEKQRLLSRNIVRVSTLLEKPGMLEHVNIRKSKADVVLEEARQLCAPNQPQ